MAHMLILQTVTADDRKLMLKRSRCY